MASDDPPRPRGDANAVTALPKRNEIHYKSSVLVHVDWTHGAAHMQAAHGITSEIANEALVTVIVVVDEGVEYDANGWASNTKDPHIYN